MTKQKSRLYTAARQVSGVLAILTLSFAVIGVFSGCNREIDDLNTGPETALQMGNHGVNSMPGPPQLLVSGLQGTSGSTIGPGGDLYVTEGAVGRISRINAQTGDVTTFASGLPPSIVGIGGAVDLLFIGETAYVLVTLVDDPLFPTGSVNGIYRIDGPDSYTVIADIGAFNLAHPPTGFDYFLKTGVLYSIQIYSGGFMVTDGHLNRVLHVTTDGQISIFKSFGNIIPTGLAVRGNKLFMAEAGPLPHLPENGRVVAFSANSSAVTDIASGARLLVDVEFNRGNTLFALSQGFWQGTIPDDAGTPAQPNTGSLVMVKSDGTFAVVAEGLDRPTSLEFIGNTAYVVTLTGEIWTVKNVAGPPFGTWQ